MRDHSAVLGVHSDGQGAAGPHLTEIQEARLLFHLRRQAVDELRAQRVFAALAEDFGREEAEDIFSRFYLHDTGFSMDPMGEEVGGMHALFATK